MKDKFNVNWLYCTLANGLMALMSACESNFHFYYRLNKTRESFKL